MELNQKQVVTDQSIEAYFTNVMNSEVLTKTEDAWKVYREANKN